MARGESLAMPFTTIQTNNHKSMTTTIVNPTAQLSFHGKSHIATGVISKQKHNIFRAINKLQVVHDLHVQENDNNLVLDLVVAKQTAFNFRLICTPLILINYKLWYFNHDKMAGTVLAVFKRRVATQPIVN